MDQTVFGYCGHVDAGADAIPLPLHGLSHGLLYVYSGTLELTVGMESYVCRQGDSVGMTRQGSVQVLNSADSASFVWFAMVDRA